MKCQVCGKESGKYPLCRECFEKKEKGEIIKCDKCLKWHLKDAPCPTEQASKFLYEPKKGVITSVEHKFWLAIAAALPKEYIVFPQINLAAFIERTDSSRFHNELFRNVDFLITDADYAPKAVVEINDQTHLTAERRERDEKVKNILEEAGIPLIKFWTSYGINEEYISKKLNEALTLKTERVHHFEGKDKAQEEQIPIAVPDAVEPKKKKGCYIATCVYGSYDCPEVWVLRRFRDMVLSKSVFGRLFIKFYYAVSPVLVKKFGNSRSFKKLMALPLNKLVYRLKINGFDDCEYHD